MPSQPNQRAVNRELRRKLWRILRATVATFAARPSKVTGYLVPFQSPLSKTSTWNFNAMRFSSTRCRDFIRVKSDMRRSKKANSSSKGMLLCIQWLLLRKFLRLTMSSHSVASILRLPSKPWEIFPQWFALVALEDALRVIIQPMSLTIVGECKSSSMIWNSALDQINTSQLIILLNLHWTLVTSATKTQSSFPLSLKRLMLCWMSVNSELKTNNTNWTSRMQSTVVPRALLIDITFLRDSRTQKSSMSTSKFSWTGRRMLLSLRLKAKLAKSLIMRPLRFKDPWQILSMQLFK